MTNDWIKWSGGECPVDPETMVEIFYADASDDVCRASECIWEHDGGETDIWFYRIVSPVTETKTLRDEFAMAALTGLSSVELNTEPENKQAAIDLRASIAFLLADAMLKARKEPGE